MVKRRCTLPLGVDLGRRRVRVALAERVERGAVNLLAVAARDVNDDIVAALCESVDELGTPERRCIVGIGPPDAVLRVVAFPTMSALERRRAARFEAARVMPPGDGTTVITLTPLPDRSAWVLGAARADALARRRTTIGGATLRAVAVDDVALALARVHRTVDGTIDIGGDATQLTIFAKPLPYVVYLPIGGDALTVAIADALGLDAGRAEFRKRAHGFAGAGEARRDALIADVVAALGEARAATGLDVRALALIGNGSRIPGLADAFERATGIAIRLAELDPALSATLPADVLRAAGADWSLAVGLALWEITA